MKQQIITLLVVAGVVLGADAFATRRSFRGGMPVGVGGNAAQVNRQAALSENMASGVGQQRSSGRKKNIRIVEAEGSFAMKCAKGDPIQVVMKEPKGFRWVAPPISSKYTCIVERGGAVKTRTANRFSGEGRAVATVRRLADESVELTLKLMKIGAPPKSDPEDTMTIGLVVP